MSGPAPKPAHRRQRTNAPRKLELVRDATDATPDCPKGLLKKTRDHWARFWSSNAAKLVDLVSDLPAIERLFWLYDERERASREARKNRLVKGSKGQPVANPLLKQIAQMDVEIRQLEDRFGLTPKARGQLGITPEADRPSLDDLNRRLAEDE